MLKFGDIDLGLKVFVPYTSLWTGHSQTILGHLISSRPLATSLQYEILTLTDGDELLLEFIHGNKPYTVSIFHGLGGNAQSDYMQRSALIALELGWNVVLVNHRAASPKAKSEKSYHSGRGEDAEAVVQWCRQKFSNSKQIALGFSMSGSILLNLLTERFGQKQPDFAIIVNAPLDLGEASLKLTQGFSKIYDYRFFLILKKLISERNNIKLPWLGHTMKIDEVYTAPANSFKDRDDYYNTCSTKDYVQRIKTKTFVLTAKDDPFVNVENYIKAKWSDAVHLTLSEYGGHMGYFSREQDSKHGRRWLDHYLESVFRKIQII